MAEGTMNENIQKLCKELLHYDDMIFGWRETVERAAKAIIKESADVVGERNYYVYGGDIKNMIFRHFGMEP